MSIEMCHAWRHQLVETMRLEDGKYYLLDRHLARMRRSASFFSYRFQQPSIMEKLETRAAVLGAGRHRVRLLLDFRGEITIEDQPFIPISNTQLISLAGVPISCDDPFVLHKTTCRKFYQRHAALHPEADQVLFFNQNQEVTETSIANLVYVLDDQLFTPPVSCGLLPGTFRQWLVDSQQVGERILTVDGLTNCKTLYLVNSVQGWMKAELSPAHSMNHG